MNHFATRTLSIILASALLATGLIGCGDSGGTAGVGNGGIGQGGTVPIVGGLEVQNFTITPDTVNVIKNIKFERKLEESYILEWSTAGGQVPDYYTVEVCAPGAADVVGACQDLLQLACLKPGGCPNYWAGYQYQSSFGNGPFGGGPYGNPGYGNPGYGNPGYGNPGYGNGQYPGNAQPYVSGPRTYRFEIFGNAYTDTLDQRPLVRVRGFLNGTAGVSKPATFMPSSRPYRYSCQCHINLGTKFENYDVEWNEPRRGGAAPLAGAQLDAAGEAKCWFKKPSYKNHPRTDYVVDGCVAR